MRIRDPFLENISPVRDPVLGFGVVGAILGDIGGIDRQAGLVRQEFQEIRRWALQRDLQRLVVNRPDAKVLQFQPAFLLVDLLGVL
jgi:hypothetical protein